MRYLMVVLLLAGCAGKPPVWEKQGATAESFDADRRECEFEAVKSVQTTDPAMRSIIGQELDKAQRRDEVGRACMRAKGYSQR